MKFGMERLKITWLDRQNFQNYSRNMITPEQKAKMFANKRQTGHFYLKLVKRERIDPETKKTVLVDVHEIDIRLIHATQSLTDEYRNTMGLDYESR